MSNENTNAAVNENPKPGTKPYLEAELAAARAEVEKLKAENENLANARAEAETKAAHETETAPAEEERVEIFVPRGYANDEPNVVIGVNGVNYVLPRGKTSSVPKHIAAEFHRSQKAQEALDKRVDELLEASKYPGTQR